MTRLPREPLDADERALAAQLPRLHGRIEPDAALDSRILAAAHAAVSSPRQVPKRRRGWIVPLTAAASVSLAVGLAWQLQPPPAPQASPAHVPVATGGAAAYEQDQAFVHAPDAAPPPPPAAVMAKPMPAPPMRQAAPVTDTARIAREAAPTEPAAESVAAAPMFVPPPPSPVVTDTVPVASAPPLPPPAPPAPPVPSQAAMARSSDTLDTVTVSGASVREQAKRARRNEAEAAADAMTSEQFAKAVDEEDVPPATMNAPAARDAWLRRIGELQQQGRIDEAKASLAEFRRRYPEAVLPAELRKLEP